VSTHPLIEYDGLVTSNIPALPSECSVSVTLSAACAIAGCVWRLDKVSTYERMPSVKEEYFAHIATDHPGYVTTSRRRSVLPEITPSMLDLARVEIAAVLA